MTVLAVAAGIWLLGWRMGVPTGLRWSLIAVLICTVVLAHLVLPAGHGLRAATGGSAASWLLLLGFGAVVAVYRRGLGWLKARVPAEPEREEGLSAAELRRYSRQIMLREIGGAGQVRLSDARVLVIGAGGLGAPVLLYLAACGVGRITVFDDDMVEVSNLQRQIIHRDSWVGRPKAQSAAAALRALNPHVDVVVHQARFDGDAAQIGDFDLVIDGSDSFETRAAVNRGCVAAGVPLVSGAISQWEGQVSLFYPAEAGPCYGCVFPRAPAPGLAPSCAEAGVLGPLPGVIGTIMAAEAVKYLTGAGETLLGRMLIYDALYAEPRVVKLRRDPDCIVCGSGKQRQPG